MITMSDWEEKLKKLQEKIKYDFKNIELLERALTTIPYAQENELSFDQHNEILRTLGDAVQDVIITNQAVTCGNNAKGFATNAKKAFAEEESQHLIAAVNELYDFIRWGKGDNGIWERTPKVLADSFEALIAVIFLDGGFNAVEQSFWIMYKNLHKKLRKSKGINEIENMRFYYALLFDKK